MTGKLVAVGLGCGTVEKSAGGLTMVQGGKGDMEDEASDAGGDSEVAGGGALGADIGDESAVGLDCKLSCGMPVTVPEGYGRSLFGRGVIGLG